MVSTWSTFSTPQQRLQICWRQILFGKCYLHFRCTTGTQHPLTRGCAPVWGGVVPLLCTWDLFPVLAWRCAQAQEGILPPHFRQFWFFIFLRFPCKQTDHETFFFQPNIYIYIYTHTHAHTYDAANTQLTQGSLNIAKYRGKRQHNLLTHDQRTLRSLVSFM